MDILIELRFYIPLDTKWVISEMLFPANLSTSTPISWLVLRKQNQNQEKQPQKYTVSLGTWVWTTCLRLLPDSAAVGNHWAASATLQPPTGRNIKHSLMQNYMSSVLWHCWLGIRKSIRPVKNFSDELLAWLSVCIWSTATHHLLLW